MEPIEPQLGPERRARYREVIRDAASTDMWDSFDQIDREVYVIGLMLADERTAVADPDQVKHAYLNRPEVRSEARRILADALG
jgi:hypothetical protein